MSEHTCTICKRRAGSLEMSTQSGKTYHVCESVTCICAIQSCGEIRDLDAIEGMALEDAMKDFAANLKKVGTFDMAKLTKGQMVTCLSSFLHAYGESMQTRILDRTAPF